MPEDINQSALYRYGIVMLIVTVIIMNACLFTSLTKEEPVEILDPIEAIDRCEDELLNVVLCQNSDKIAVWCYEDSDTCPVLRMNRTGIIEDMNWEPCYALIMEPCNEN